MSAEDEMRAQKITFILCMELSLKTSLNSALSGERRVMLVLAFQSFIFLSAELVGETNIDVKKTEFDQARAGPRI